MTLVEVMVSLTILMLIFAGLLSTIIQSRRLTEGSIRRSLATQIATSYLEQIKAMPVTSIVQNPLQTQDDQVTNDYLNVSTGSIPSLKSFNAGTTPSGVADNLKDFPMYSAGSSGAPSTWASIWPGASTAPSTTPYVNDLHLNIWVWVSDMSSYGVVATGTAYSVTMIYTWRVNDGGRVRYYDDETHAIVSSVSAFE